MSTETAIIFTNEYKMKHENPETKIIREHFLGKGNKGREFAGKRVGTWKWDSKGKKYNKKMLGMPINTVFYNRF